MFGVLHVATLASASGLQVNMNKVAQPALGIAFVVIGNYLGKMRSNFTCGIRTPWTLSSELSWNKTHRLGGRLFFVFGLVMLVLPFTPIPMHAGWGIFVCGALLSAIIPAVYSYFIWKQDKNI